MHAGQEQRFNRVDVPEAQHTCLVQEQLFQVTARTGNSVEKIVLSKLVRQGFRGQRRELFRGLVEDAHASKLAHVAEDETAIVVEIKDDVRVRWEKLIVGEGDKLAGHAQVCCEHVAGFELKE